jgi:hypothetical protein
MAFCARVSRERDRKDRRSVETKRKFGEEARDPLLFGGEEEHLF